MPVLLNCDTSAGFGYTDDASVAGKYVCQGAATGNTPQAGFSATWPTLQNGWAYAQPTGSLSGNDYTYTATKSGQTTITCVFNGAKCN